MATGPMFANIRYGTYIFFAIMNLAWILPGTYFLFPETKQKSLEEVSAGDDDADTSLISSLLWVTSRTRTRYESRAKTFLKQARQRQNGSWVGRRYRLILPGVYN